MADITIRADDAARIAAKGFACGYLSKGFNAEGLHVYTLQDGAPIFWRFRCKHPDGRKEIRPFWQAGQGFKLGEPLHPNGRPLYNLALLAGADCVLLVEGEKAADACTKRGLVTLSTGGASNATSCNFTPLAGRAVYLWPDHDAAGTQWACELLPRLLGMGCTVWTIDPASSGVPDKGDAFDWFAQHPDGNPFTDLDWECQTLQPELFEQDEQPAPYPLEALPQQIRAAVGEVVDYLQCPPALAAMSALQAAATVAQGLADVARDEKLISPCSLFLLAVADSGERKTTVDGYFMKPIRNYASAQAEVMQQEVRTARADRAKWAAEKAGILKVIEAAGQKSDDEKMAEQHHRLRQHEAAEPAPLRVPRFELGQGDFSFESITSHLHEGWPTAVIASSEGGSFFGGRAAENSGITRLAAALNVLWDSGSFTVDRKRADDSYQLIGRRLSMSLMVQAPVLRDFMERTESATRGSGLMARFLMGNPSSTIGTRTYREPPASWPGLDAYHRRLADLAATPLNMDSASGRLTTTLIHLNREAKQVWTDYFDRIEAESGGGGDYAALCDVAAKSADNAARIACVLHMLKHGAYGRIEADTMQSAVAIAQWHLDEARRLLVPAGKPLSQTEKDAKELLHWLQGKGWKDFTRNKLGQYAPGQLRKDANRRTAAIDELLRRRWLTESTGELTLFQQAAVAVSAVSAVWTEANSSADSKNSTDSNSNPGKVMPQQDISQPKLMFAQTVEATPPLHEPITDQLQWLADLEAASMEF
ncbi:YfjI family protein [Chitinilyticum aquatile]|uniref:YfjI family protein n=1 Tax=Chitinilyticum aquatile TaxID=362520 RepID=UPI000405FDC7|nr:YfjI family protein [Chitinilyticum aquatile]